MTDKKQEQEQQEFDYSFRAEPDANTDLAKIDALNRMPLIKKLTAFVKNSQAESSMVVSVHGEWGTGKTFLLQMLRQQLQIEKCQAVYFNAWEDDFQSNPLVAIIGQLWKVLKKSDLQEIGESLPNAILSITEKTANKFAGIGKRDFQSSAEQTVGEYLETREKLDDLKERLKTLAATVKKSTGFPLVFIVDELDRCRPTFAIELLERVKHVLNVPNTVFIFGINKTQLAKSIESVYGDINAEEYLQRFFDMPLVLSPARPSVYCEHLLSKYEVIEKIGKSAVHNATYGHFDGWNGSWKVATEDMYATMVDYMNLSLREVEHSLRMFLFVLYDKETKDKGSRKMHKKEGWSVICLIFLRLKFPDLYWQFVRGDCASKDVIDAMHQRFPPDQDLENMHDNHRDRRSIRRCKDVIEAEFYRFTKQTHQDEIERALHLHAKGETADTSVYLAERTKANPSSHAQKIVDFISEGAPPDGISWSPLQKIAGMLDLMDTSNN